MAHPASESNHAPGTSDLVFSPSDLRLTGRQWLLALALILPFVCLAPRVWTWIERFDTGPDYRLPYALSRDYWLYERRLVRETVPSQVIVLGDSVVWGEYVRPDGTWSAFLNRTNAAGYHFVNAGVNGLFPLALEGLVDHHASLPRGQKVLLQCNLLWMTSPQADLSSEKEEHFNHARLVPQFSPRLPCYRADATERLGAVVQRSVPFLGWVNHLQDAYFQQKSLPGWTLADDGGDPPKYPNAQRNPLAQITRQVPPAPLVDPDRGPDSPRHRSWSGQTPGRTNGTTRFEWVPLAASQQWAAFQRMVEKLRARGADVFVVVGPFNEHLLAEDNRPAFRSRRDDIVAWLSRQQIPHAVPATLPSELYADASHPLTAGYELLAHLTVADPEFRRWLGTAPSPGPSR